MVMDEPRLVINPVLTYCFHYVKSHDHNAIRDVLINFYCDEAISEAKCLLWESYADHLPPFEKRVNRGLRSIREKESEDILSAVKTLDSKFAADPFPVIFVTVNLQLLPPYKPGESESQAIADRLQLLEGKVDKLITRSCTNDAHGIDHPSSYSAVAAASAAAVSRDLGRPRVNSLPNRSSTTQKQLQSKPKMPSKAVASLSRDPISMPSSSFDSDDFTEVKKPRKRPKAVIGK
mgnify:CR=1 FL=1